MTRKVGDKVKVNGSIQEIESITQWDKDIQRYEFIGGSGWHKIKEGLEERSGRFGKREKREQKS